MFDRLIDLLPDWLHPRFPLVANEMRAFRRVDFRIEQIGKRLKLIYRGLILLPLAALVLTLLIDSFLFGFILFPVAVAVVIATLLFSEALLLYALVGVPRLTAQMIAGEMQQGTWESVLSTPLRRNQIVLSKFGATFWNSAHVIEQIFLARLIAISFLIIEGLILGGVTDELSSEIAVLIIIIAPFIVILPLIEIAMLAAIGLLISYLSMKVDQSNSLTWTFWLSWRIITGLVFTVIFASITGENIFPMLGLTMLSPGAVLMLLMQNAVIDFQVFLLIGIVFVLLPLLILVAGLALTVRMVQYQSTNPLRFRRGS